MSAVVSARRRIMLRKGFLIGLATGAAVYVVALTAYAIHLPARTAQSLQSARSFAQVLAEVPILTHQLVLLTFAPGHYDAGELMVIEAQSSGNLFPSYRAKRPQNGLFCEYHTSPENSFAEHCFNSQGTPPAFTEAPVPTQVYFRHKERLCFLKNKHPNSSHEYLRCFMFV